MAVACMRQLLSETKVAKALQLRKKKKKVGEQGEGKRGPHMSIPVAAAQGVIKTN